jgi:hypothetical protein
MAVTCFSTPRSLWHQYAAVPEDLSFAWRERGERVLSAATAEQQSHDLDASHSVAEGLHIRDAVLSRQPVRSVRSDADRRYSPGSNDDAEHIAGLLA